MNIFPELMISASGLTAERARMEVISRNIANVNTTQTAEGGVFKRQLLEVMAAGETELGLHGAEVMGIVEDTAPPKMIYDPKHPDADEDSYRAQPNIAIMMEMVDMLSASRAYEANVKLLQSAKEMVRQALTI